MADLRRSLIINFFSSSGAAIVQFFVSVLLARMLSPSEIGIFSITVVFVNIAHIFRDFGVTSYLQREPDLTPEKMRAAIGVLYASSWLIAVLLFLSSDWIGKWFNEPGIPSVMQVLSLGFLFIPFGSVTHALLTREFAANKQAIVMIAGTLSFSISCIAFAALGFGSMSLAWANLINIIVTAIAYIPFRPKGVPWLPSFRHWRSVVSFGTGSIISNCAVAINNAIPDVLLGKLGSARHVGLFSRANSTVTIFAYVAGSTANYGAVSYLSQTYHRGESMVPVLSRATALLTGLGWPVLALTALLGNDVVLALYGSNWLESVPAILPLTIAAAIMMVFHYSPPALAALGKPYLASIPIGATLLMRIVFGIVLFDGTLESFAWAICLATALASPLLAAQQSRYFGYRIRQIARTTWPSAVVSLVCAMAAEAISIILPETLPAAIRLLIMSVPLTLVWYAGLRMTRHELLSEVHRMMAGVKTSLTRQSV